MNIRAIKNSSEAINVINEYSNTFTMLYKYDEGGLSLEGTCKNIKYILDYDTAFKAIEILKDQLIADNNATKLFGIEKNSGSLEGLLNSVFYNMDGSRIYSSIEELAVNLITSILDISPFIEGNKSIAGLLFLLFLERNSYNNNDSGDKKISGSVIEFLPIMLQESDPKLCDLHKNLLINILKTR